MMKTLLGAVGACLLLCASLLPVLSRHSVASASPTPQGPATLYCASENGRRNYCQADISNGIQLYKQRSESPCRFGQTWGYDDRGIWVDRGCRAEFVAGYAGNGGGGNWSGWGQNYNVYCASEDGGRAYCPVDVRGGVRLVRRRSESPCRFGESWGSDPRGIWVDRGCRADFEVGESGWQPESAYTIYCASDDGERKHCKANTRDGVRIIRQRSESDCIYGRTWGTDKHGIWVDRGCRADFAINTDR